MVSAEARARLLARFADLETRLGASDPAGADYARLSKDWASLRSAADLARRIDALAREFEALEVMRREAAGDREMIALAEEEARAILARREALEAELARAMAAGGAAGEGGDEDDAIGSVILEIRAGTGGEEAALFAGDLMRMYQRYAASRGWLVEILNLSESETGGAREAILSIGGAEVFRRLRFESGVHRVQRVPVTESGGRIHTSAATVAVLPQPEEREVEIVEKDLRIDVFRARGPGGQSVNTTDSAVRITHIPSGIVVAQQDEKSQHRNKAKALRVLRARLYEREREAARLARDEARRGQIGTGDRSERIRTYNFPQNRVSDHRIRLTVRKLDMVLDGALDLVVGPLLGSRTD